MTPPSECQQLCYAALRRVGSLVLLYTEFYLLNSGFGHVSILVKTAQSENAVYWSICVMVALRIRSGTGESSADV